MTQTHKLIGTVVTTAACALALGIAQEARADHLEACGGVVFDLQASVECEVVQTQDCEVRCEPAACINVCARRAVVECSPSCVLEAEVECHVGCTESCVPSCETTPAEPPNCMGLCMSDCQQDCNGQCDGVQDQGECRSSCAHCCSDDCHAKCDGQEQAECAPVCESACSGSCDARANLDCSMDCQRDLILTCEQQVVQECRNECESTGAAIFCNGQFLATAGNLQACADELSLHFGIELDVDIDVDVDVDAGASDGGDDDVFSCGSSIEPNPTNRPLALGLIVLLGAVVWGFRRTSVSVIS